MSPSLPEIKHALLPSFTFVSGATKDVKIAYLDLNPSTKKTALIPTCFGGRLLSTQNFSSGVLANHRIIVAALFSNGESSSPSNDRHFPESLDYRDCVRAQYRLVREHLHIEALDVVLGFSMGGQTAYYWAALYPDFVHNAISICSSARTSGHNFQFLEGPRNALLNSADFVAGKEDGRGVRAFWKAYSAWLTSAEWFDEERYKNAGYQSQKEWDGAVCDKGDGDWPGVDLLMLSAMWQKGDVAVCQEESGGDLETALGLIKARMLVMPCETDQYFRPGPSRREVKALKRGTLRIIPSIWGHIAGGGANAEDTKYMDKEIADFLSQA